MRLHCFGWPPTINFEELGAKCSLLTSLDRLYILFEGLPETVIEAVTLRHIKAMSRYYGVTFELLTFACTQRVWRNHWQTSIEPARLPVVRFLYCVVGARRCQAASDLMAPDFATHSLLGRIASIYSCPNGL